MVPCPKRQRPNEVQAMFFGFQLTCGLMMVFYGYSVMKNPRVWGDQGRRAVKPEHFEEYGRQNGLFFLKAGCVMAVIGALDALVTLDALLYLLLYPVLHLHRPCH